ncbi:hypothetical protein Tco_0008552 [Tanacetum coccineum]
MFSLVWMNVALKVLTRMWHDMLSKSLGWRNGCEGLVEVEGVEDLGKVMMSVVGELNWSRKMTQFLYLVTLENRIIERYVYGLAPQIRGMVATTEPKTMQKAVQISGALTDEAVRNGSIKKVKKRGNVGEPNKDRGGRDDNKT